jgi:diguanylate cyclase (GGDEF)-like protein/PAS domain S-box-containing protein
VGKPIEDFALRIFEGMADGILFVNADGIITICNERAAELRGIASCDIVSQSVANCHPADSMPKVQKVMDDLKNNPKMIQTRTVHRGNDYFEINYSAVADASGVFLGILAISRKITEKVALNRKLIRLSTTDELTKLGNHRHFLAVLKQETVRGKRQKRDLALLLFDLDKFKHVNDTTGHATGDVVLRSIGLIVKKHIRRHIDQAFRYGGDEFTVIMPEASLDVAKQAAERLRGAVEEAGLYDVTLSVGVAAYDPADVEIDLIRKADAAMYRIKRQGGNGVCEFDKTCLK